MKVKKVKWTEFNNAAYMVEISQKNSNGGDGKISKVNITKNSKMKTKQISYHH